MEAIGSRRLIRTFSACFYLQPRSRQTPCSRSPGGEWGARRPTSDTRGPRPPRRRRQTSSTPRSATSSAWPTPPASWPSTTASVTNALCTPGTPWVAIFIDLLLRPGVPSISVTSEACNIQLEMQLCTPRFEVPFVAAAADKLTAVYKYCSE